LSTLFVLQFIPVTDTSQNSHKEKTNDQAKAKAAKHGSQKGGSGKGFVLSNFLAIAFGSLGCILIGLAINYHTKGGYHAVKLALLWGIIGYALFGVGLYFTYYEYVIKPARATERARQKAEAERVLSLERPELFVEHTTPDRIVAGQPVRMHLIVRNRGKMTAHKVRIGATHGLFKSAFDGPLIYNTIPADVSPSIGADAGFEYISISSWIVKRQHLVDLQAGKIRLFHYGKGTYEDEAGKEFVLQFCAMYEPSVSTVVMCPDKYLPTTLTDVPELPERRPEISLESAFGYCKPGKRAEIKAVFMNRGQVTAYDLEMRGTTYFAVAKTFKGPIEHAPNEPAVAYPALAPGAQMTGWTEGLGRVLSIQDVDKIVSGELLFLHYTEGRYKDEDGNVYTIDFCLMYEPNRKVMKIAPRAYWPQNTA
jgi:hypothetical protein